MIFRSRKPIGKQADQTDGASGGCRQGRPGRNPPTRPSLSCSSSFNPRPRTGGDCPAREYHDGQATVSIRAPARGATSEAQATILRFRRFNPRPRTGGDWEPWGPNCCVCPFQSAPPHGGRLRSASASAGEPPFQSAPPHGGRRQGRSRSSAGCAVSIRAPARGATTFGLSIRRGTAVSIRAPARGATPRSQP